MNLMNLMNLMNNTLLRTCLYQKNCIYKNKFEKLINASTIKLLRSKNNVI